MILIKRRSLIDKVAKLIAEADTKPEQKTYIASPKEREILNLVLKDYIKGRTVNNKSYAQFNGRSLYDCIDDWTKRWNGYIPEGDPLLDKTQSRMFLNFTRNCLISYLSKTALKAPEPKIIAINKKTGIEDKQFADILKDLNKYSLNEENGDARFLESAIEASVKGTVIKFEGYMRTEQTIDVPTKFDPTTGEIKYKREKKVTFDNCFQKIVPVEDFYIPNPYQIDVQKQPFVIWREITSYQEASLEYGDYPNWDKVPQTAYLLSSEPTTFYRNTLQTELGKDQCEVIKYYNRFKKGTLHAVIVNGVVIYSGPIPFKDGKYPFAVGVFERFGNDFFWGMGFPQKVQGNQDLQNTFLNMMADKTFNSLLPFALSSDLDDFVDDEVLTLGKIRKVGDISKWSIQEWPSVSAGEMDMMQLVMGLGEDDANNVRSAEKQNPKIKGKMTARQALLQNQEMQAKLGFSMSYMEDFERDRTALRLPHILQFYSIPRIEKITGKNGQEVEKLMYREIRLPETTLSNGKQGQKILQLTGKTITNPDKRKQIGDDLSQKEAMGYLSGVPTEALNIAVDTFTDYNYSIQIVKKSSYESTSILDQAQRQDFASWRLSLAQIAPIDAPKLVDWVSESYEDFDPDEFKPKQQPPQPGQDQQAQLGQQAPGSAQQPNQMGAKKLGNLATAL